MPHPAVVAVAATAAATAAAVAIAGPRRIARLVRRVRGRDAAARRQLDAIAVREAATAGTERGRTPEGADDLRVIEGIGPRIEGVLHDAEITTFARLAETSPGRLETIMREAGRKMADPTTWPEQARLAADGDWKALQELQGTLKRGRRT